MDEFLLQLEKTLQSGSYYASLFMCLCVPDICAALESVDGRTTGARYTVWFDTNLTTKAQRQGIDVKYTPMFDGNEAYLLRCAALHQGQLANTGTGTKPGSKYIRIIFQEPSPTVVHLGLITEPAGEVLILNLAEFCQDMIVSARAWLAGIQGTEPFESNYSLMIKRYPHGLSPYIVGPAIIT